MKQIIIVGTALILLIVFFSGCLEITSRNGNPMFGGNVQPWDDGTITFQSVDYIEKYSPKIGDYRNAVVRFTVDYDVYIDTEMGFFHVVTNKGETVGGDWEGYKNNGKKDTGCGFWGLVKFSRSDSPGSYNVTFTSSNLEPDDTVKSLIFTIITGVSTNKYERIDYTIPINEYTT